MRISVVLKVLFGIFLFFGTIYFANAVTYDNYDYYIITPGTNISGSVIMYDVQNNISVDEYNSWLTINDINRVDKGIYLVDYSLSIPDNTPIDFYKINMTVIDGDNMYDYTIRTEVQTQLFAWLFTFMKGKYMPYFYAFVLVFLSGLVIWKGGK